MSQCISVGIQGRQPSERRASGIHVIEHITYGIRNEEMDVIELVADLFLPNCDSNDRIFSFIHVGNIGFKALPAKEIFSHKNFFTSFLEKRYAPSLGGRFERKEGHIYGFPRHDIEPVDIRGTDKYCTTLSCRKGNKTSYTPFTLCKVQIPGRTFGFVRVSGTIVGETLNILTKGKTLFDVYGGEVLLNRIRTEHMHNEPYRDAKGEFGDKDEYKNLFNDFVENYYVEPDRYDIVLRSLPGTRLVKTRRLSRDLFLGCEGGILHREQIDWYWSRSAQFYVSSYPNGLRVGVELETCGKAWGQFAAKWRSRW